MASPVTRPVGPILFFRGHDNGRVQLAALLAIPQADQAPELRAGGAPVTPEALLTGDGMRVLRYSFSLPATADAAYDVYGTRYRVHAAVDCDLRLAYVSCNGQERGDRERAPDERNALWMRLARQHEEAGFALLLQGGDQLYADEMLDVHPRLRAWAAGDDYGAVREAEANEIRARLHSYLLQRYLELYAQSAPARLMARVPTLCMWDDHDICDGWGSLPAEQLDAPLGRLVFAVARELFLVFQLAGSPDDLPPICLDPSGASLGWAVQLPGVTLIAPDLRSERRPERVLGPAGQAVLDQALEAAPTGHVFMLSSVPALGPRLSWVEAAMGLTPHAEKYEDDLRDQWQSRTHRAEWRTFLQRLLAVHEDGQRRVTVLSGEIHLATRGTMAARTGPLHQLVASGITHPPPPRAYARALGALARLGEAPLPEHPIRLEPLPAQRGVYTPQRNYLVLARREGRWRAWWELEHDGATPPLALDE